MSTEKSPNDLLSEYIDVYLEHKDKMYMGDELEIKFGTKRFNQINKVDFDNIISKLKSLDFYPIKPEGEYTMNITNEYADARTGKMRDSNIRTTLTGIRKIQKYCKENRISEDKLMNVTFLQKFRKTVGDTGDRLHPIDFHDFHFRVNYKTERNVTPKRGDIKPGVAQLIDNWRDTKKVFRFIKRYTFVHRDKTDFPFKIDLSIVKSNKQRRLASGRKVFVKEYSVEEANVFNEPENYEVEIELMNSIAKTQVKGELMYKIKKAIKMILSGWQKTNFPTAYTEHEQILKEYMVLLHGKENVPKNQYGKVRRANTRDFIGPSSISLEVKNIMPLDIDSAVANINHPYTVTDKADGERKLLFITHTGRMYFIDTNMKVQFTGSITKHKTNFHTIIDGEHVLFDKNGNFINTYLAFDVYFKENENTMGYSFMNVPNEEVKSESKSGEKYRIEILASIINGLDSICVVKNYDTPISIKMKKFYSNIGGNIFTECKKILDGDKEGILFNYETDGLIFTPCDKSVGSSKTGETISPRRIRWDYSLKWKPPKFNTIDFLVRTKKIETGEDFIGNIFTDGSNVYSNQQINQYKTLILHVGFDENKHGFINPCDNIINDTLPKYNAKSEYKAMPFIPYDPMPSYPIYTTNILLKEHSGEKQLFIESNDEVFYDNMVVEFRWEETMEQGWQWIPIRVRYDKTAEYQRTGKVTCNAYTTAEGVWRSINKPVTEKMITTGNDIPTVVNDNIYYDRTNMGVTNTQGLRDFHNRFVKRKIITSVSKRGDTLIDMSVGMGGDLQKWIDAKLSFVFGLDYSKDNIHNRIRGVCSRYLNSKKKYRVMPGGLFIQGDSSLNIKNGDACFTEKGKQIVNALNGIGPKDETVLGKGVYKRYGVAKHGFNIVSNQFSIHYFFKNRNTFYNFIQNLNENCKVGGYVIGTCYDGSKVFRLLEQKQPGESVFIMNENDTKMWDIKKLYNSTSFADDDTSLGYAVDVYQESINKTFTEYLVNFDFLIRVMENYGFVPINDSEAQRFGFPSGIGSFEKLFNIMEDDIEQNKLKRSDVGKAINMTQNEKTISFLNNYFIFKKVRNPNAVELTNQVLTISEQQEELNKQDTEEVKSEIKKTKKSKINKRKVKKFKKKLKLPK